MTPAVLLISPGIVQVTDTDFGLPHLVALGGYVRERTGARVELLDLGYEGGDHAHLLRTITELGPLLVVGLACYSSFDYRRVMALARFLREALPDVPLVTGGYHASARPGDMVFDGSPFDAVILGEGERPMAAVVEALLGGAPMPRGILAADLVEDLDTLPPYAWDLLKRYWPRATRLGRKLQIYLSRGCPYRCTFCMERAKSGYRWRAYSPERAVDELERLASFTDLKSWIINIADPLFGLQRSWRRGVLEEIARRDLVPRQFWTLTRSDDLDDEDMALLARARFAIGIGLESGSPEMLRRMQKGNTPERYLAAVENLARRSHDHGLTWAVNVIVGHPGETPKSLQETHAFVTRLFSFAPTTRGWLSVDPFRLYPGSAVAEDLPGWSERTGARFHAPRWWTRWADEGFWAQYIDPGHELAFAGRVRRMHTAYAPLLDEIADRFVGQGREIDRVFRRSIAQQQGVLSAHRRDGTLARAAQAGPHLADRDIRFPIGLNIKDPLVFAREQAVRRALDSGRLRSHGVIAAVLGTGAERFVPPGRARSLLTGAALPPEGELAHAPPLDAVIAALEGLAIQPGECVADLTCRSGYMAALLAELVGPGGRVIAAHPGAVPEELREALAPWPQVELVEIPPGDLSAALGPFDAAWIGAALPRWPAAFSAMLEPLGGRAAVAIGPRFRPQDLRLVLPDGCWSRLARVRAPVLVGPEGWMRERKTPQRSRVVFSRHAAPALCFHLLSRVRLPGDAADLWGGEPPPGWASAVAGAIRVSASPLTVQVSALAHRDADAWMASLATHPPDSPERALLHGAQIEGPRFLAEWFRQTQDAQTRLRDRGDALTAPLSRLRERLWEASGRPPPDLEVIDCPALGRHARATTLRGRRVVAVSLTEEPGYALCQILHEEMHPITDPLVEMTGVEASVPRQTRRDTPGWSHHQALEETAVAATHAFLSERAPEFLPDFARWTARQGTPPAAPAAGPTSTGEGDADTVPRI